MLLQKGLELEERDFFKEPFTEDEIRGLASEAGSISQLFAWRSPSLKQKGLAGRELSEAEMVALIDSALDALMHSCWLELALWASAPTRDEQRASLLAPFDARATEGPIAFVKHRGTRAKGTEDLFIWAQLVAGWSNFPAKWVHELDVAALMPRLRGIVRRQG